MADKGPGVLLQPSEPYPGPGFDSHPGRPQGPAAYLDPAAPYPGPGFIYKIGDRLGTGVLALATAARAGGPLYYIDWFPPVLTTKQRQAWDGSGWHDLGSSWNGSQWVPLAGKKIWNGSSWVVI